MPMDWIDEAEAREAEAMKATGDGKTQMLRYNGGKLPFGLAPSDFVGVFIKNPDVPRDLLIETTKVLDFGAKKYAANNWRIGGPWVSVYNSFSRHLILGIMAGEINDSDSGLNHWGHVGCNLAFLLEFHTHGIGEDDRFIRPNKAQYQWKNEGNENRVDNLLEDMLVWLDGGGPEHIESAIIEAAMEFGDNKR